MSCDFGRIHLLIFFVFCYSISTLICSLCVYYWDYSCGTYILIIINNLQVNNIHFQHYRSISIAITCNDTFSYLFHMAYMQLLKCVSNSIDVAHKLLSTICSCWLMRYHCNDDTLHYSMRLSLDGISLYYIWINIYIQLYIYTWACCIIASVSFHMQLCEVVQLLCFLNIKCSYKGEYIYNTSTYMPFQAFKIHNISYKSKLIFTNYI